MSDQPQHQSHIDKLREEQRRLRAEVRERTVGYILAALGLVAGLAWNNAVMALIKAVFPGTGSGVLAQFIYAVVLTVIVAIAVYYISKFFAAKKK